MGTVFHIISPILLLVVLGYLLARIRFLGAAFMADLNKLAFWVALPALLFRSVAKAESPGPRTLDLVLLLAVVTVVIAIAGWLAGGLLRLSRHSFGTLSQSAFRGNLAYVGVPVLAYAFDGRADFKPLFATAVIAMTLLMALYNISAVIVLQASRGGISAEALRSALRAIVTNPLLIAAAAGLPLGLTHTPLPLFVDRFLETLGGAAVPVALLCIGGSLALPVPRASRTGAVATGAMLKVVLAPMLAWLAAPWFGVQGADLTIAMVFAACPTAAAAYVMARQMDGDEPLAGRTIVLSTLLSFVSVPAVLWFTR